MTARYDLHCHSIYSDGTNTVTELFEMATQLKLAGLSITDHDTIKAYNEGFQLLHNYPLKLLPGLEISSVYEEHSVHILTYGFSQKDPKVIQFIEKIERVRLERNKEILEKLHQAGIILDEKWIKEDIGVVGRPHFAQAMLEKGYVQNTKEAFDRYIGDGEFCFAPGQRPEVQEVLNFIHEVNAFAVIAHPHLIKNNNLLKALLTLPFDGLEVYYAKFTPKDEKKWSLIADHRGWIKTGGSDFHGEVKPHITLGCSWVGEETFKKLYQRYLENDSLF